MKASVHAEWDGGVYAANTAHHRRHDDVVLSGLTDLPAGATIVDVGCGVGDFTVRLLDLDSTARVIGVDADASMVATAQQRAQASGARVDYVQAPAQHVADALGEGIADAVVSTACLHWIPGAEHPPMLEQFHRLLKPGGLLRVEFGGFGQIESVRVMCDAVSASLGGRPAPWYFPEAAPYAEVLADAGFEPGEVRLLHQLRHFADVETIQSFLRSQVLVAYQGGLAAAVWDEFVDTCLDKAKVDLRRDDGSYDLDFVRTFVSVRRGA